MSEAQTTHATTTASQLISTLTHKVLIQDYNVQEADTSGRSTKYNAPLMIWGQPGVGKSDIIREVGRRTNRPVRDIRLLLKDPTDIAGLPYYNNNTNLMEYGLPVDFPTNEDANDIILLDELPSAPASVQIAALQLLLERQIGTYKLPKNVFMVAAGNRASDGTVHYSMPAPLRNRLEHTTLEVNAESWLQWAETAELHPSVISFIKENPNDLNSFDAKQKQRYAFATPRTWEFVSKEIRGTEYLMRKGVGRTVTQMFDSIIGLIGVDTAIKFKVHYNNTVSLPDPFEIVKGKVLTADIDSMSLRYNCCLNIAFALREMTVRNTEVTPEEKSKYVDNGLRFLIKKGNIREKDLIISTFQLLKSENYKVDIVTSPVVEELLDDEEFSQFFSAI